MSEQFPSTPAVAPKPRAPRWIIIALTVSVAINVAAIGWGATRFYMFRDMAREPMNRIEMGIARHLPPAAAEAFRKAAHDEMAKNRFSLSETRRDISGALGAEPFDPAKLESVMAARRKNLEQIQIAVQNGLLAAAQAMTPEERHKYAERIGRFRHKDRD